MERDRGDVERRGGDGSRGILDALEASVARGCESRAEWPARVGSGIVAGVEFAIDQPAVVDALILIGWPQSPSNSEYRDVIQRLARMVSRGAPGRSRLPGSTDEALVAGIVGLVGDHIRLGSFDALRRLEPDLVLLVLLPYLGFEEAQKWANKFADR
jgi:hypothetical protein